MMTISALTSDDFQRIYAIECASHAFPWSEKTFMTNIGERYCNLKLEVDGKIVGFAINQFILDEATLFNIAVDPEYQGQGYGKMLLSAAIEKLAEKGVMTLWLEVRESNRSAIALYETIGFNEVSIRKNYYPAKNGKEDAVIMALYI